MGNLLKVLFAITLLGVPLVVISALPRFFELAGSVPATTRQTAETVPAAPAFRLIDATPASTRKFASLDETPPPTLAPPATTATPGATPRPQPTGERVTIGNTGGQGAVLRADPVSGRPLGTLRENQVVDVIERRAVPGSGNWVHVRTNEGLDGWVIGLVALPAR
ncbi:MAG TPA: SH3 domain-containing protein [Chloroflexota bacterium]|nr:SH3 domain-containing protein [Chloroflexota bacterium]